MTSVDRVTSPVVLSVTNRSIDARSALLSAASLSMRTV
jgi:hypothetical protein